MHNYVAIDKNIWSNKKFKSLPGTDCKILYLYLISNPAITLTGIYSLDLDDCKLKTQLNSKFNECLIEVTNGKYNIDFDKEKEIVWVKTRFERITAISNSPKIIVGAILELNTIDHKFKNSFIEKYKEELEPFLFRLKGYKIKKEEFLTEEFLLNASKIYSTKAGIKKFVETKGVDSEKIDSILNRILPNLK